MEIFAPISKYVVEHLPNLVVAGVFVYYLITVVDRKDRLIERKDNVIQDLNLRMAEITAVKEKTLQALITVDRELQELKAEIRHKIPNGS